MKEFQDQCGPHNCYSGAPFFPHGIHVCDIGYTDEGEIASHSSPMKCFISTRTKFNQIDGAPLTACMLGNALTLLMHP